MERGDVLRGRSGVEGRGCSGQHAEHIDIRLSNLIGKNSNYVIDIISHVQATTQALGITIIAGGAFGIFLYSELSQNIARLWWLVFALSTISALVFLGFEKEPAASSLRLLQMYSLPV